MGRSERATILVVDDDRAVADVYARQLSETYEVRTAYDGHDALESITEEVDVVLLDRRMPDLAGREVLDRIREEGYTCGVIVVTALDPGFDIVDMGFDDYLVKPVTKDELESAVAETLDRLDRTELVREYLALASKVATLRVEKDPTELEESDEYAALTDRLDELAERADIDEADIDSPLDR